MANTAYTNPVGGFWPFGKISIATSGVPVKLTVNVGSQEQGSAFAMQMSRRLRQIIFVADPTSAGNIFITKAGHPYTDTNCVVLVVWNNGNEYSLPHGSLLQGVLVPPDDLSVDADKNGSSVYAVGIYG